MAKSDSLSSRGDARRDKESGLFVALFVKKLMIVDNVLWLVSTIQTYDSTYITLELVDPPSTSAR